MQWPKRNFKFGYALGGGAARGIAHIGVLKALDECGIKPDYISGTSAGAIVGALYSAGISPQYIYDVVTSMTRADWIKMMDLSLFKNGLMKGERLMQWLKEYTGGDIDFNNLRIPFSAVATDINNGEKVALNNGSVWDAVRASISIPVIFSVVERNDRFLVDGGLSETVPVDTVKDMGADFTLAINVIPLSNDRLISPEFITKNNKHENRPGMLHVAMHVYEISDARIITDSLKHANFVIEPDTSQIGPTDFKKAKECADAGYVAAITNIDTLKKALATFQIKTIKEFRDVCPPQVPFAII
ncbi:MAG: patatin-like phospholipase family protein [Chloroflexi bacterium]|nr:patatin-like phospholipase family protein [Chloroflexota bacterium]